MIWVLVAFWVVMAVGFGLAPLFSPLDDRSHMWRYGGGNGDQGHG
jgi:hypothetical protein